jgi:microcystin degradation protein MlrC
MARVGLISVWQEVNTYSPRSTTLEQFEEKELAIGDAIARRHSGARSVIGGFLDEPSFDHVPILAAGAWPGGPPDASTAEELLSRLDSALAGAGRLDGVLLDFHGAMVCKGHPDMELEVVNCVREHIGDRPIAGVLDLHAIPSPDFVAGCDALIGYETYPHVDVWERGREAAALIGQVLAGRRLCSRVAKLPLLTTPVAQASAEEPMRFLNERAAELAESARLARISLLPGFPYSDVERVGFSVIGVADESLSSELEATLDVAADIVESRVEDFSLSRPPPSRAVEMAAAADRTPVVLVDLGDNIGAGGAGDGTALLAELLAQQVEGALVTIADAEMARRAHQGGPGSDVEGPLGGKQDDLHGEPVQIRGSVLLTSDGAYVSRGDHLAGLEFKMGRSALLAVSGLRVLVTERAVPPFHGEQLTSMGVELASARVITAKGAVAWRTAFGDVARTVIEADTPGVTPLDPSRLPRTAAPMSFRAGDR